MAALTTNMFIMRITDPVVQAQLNTPIYRAIIDTWVHYFINQGSLDLVNDYLYDTYHGGEWNTFNVEQAITQALQLETSIDINIIPHRFRQSTLDV